MVTSKFLQFDVSKKALIGDHVNLLPTSKTHQINIYITSKMHNIIIICRYTELYILIIA